MVLFVLRGFVLILIKKKIIKLCILSQFSVTENAHIGPRMIDIYFLEGKINLVRRNSSY